MKATVVSANEWLYPDITEYKSAKASIDLHAPRGGYAATQVIFFDRTPGDAIKVSCEGLEGLSLSVYRMLDVCVQYNANGPEAIPKGWTTVEQGTDTSGWTTRQAPFYAFDILQPYEDGGNTVDKPACALYLCWEVPLDAAPGEYEGCVSITIGSETACVPAKVCVHKVQLPKERRLKITNWYAPGNISKYHGVELWSDEWFAMLKKYFALMNRTRQTHLMIGLGTIRISRGEDGKYIFDFSLTERLIREALAAGFQTLELGHLCGRNYLEEEKYWAFYWPDGKKTYADSPEGYEFFAQFLPAWREFLTSHGWYDISVQHIGDEPEGSMSDDFRIISAMVRKFLPGMKLFDAIRLLDLVGSVDGWVPLNSAYEQNRKAFDRLRELGDDVWQYTCCSPRGVWLNRFIDKELLQPRLLHYGNYKYNLTGYLHWGFNYFQADTESLRACVNGHSDDGIHYWPAGDTHLCYPGAGSGPWMSIRAEQMRLGVEDCELLWMLEKADKAKADALCENVMRRFDDYTVDPLAFEANYIKLLNAADAI